VSAVTSPILRIHPTTLAQAASTVYALSEGRFVLGLGTGENLNEHIVGEGFPPFPQRLARLGESLAMVRRLLQGEEVSWKGDFFQIDRARLFDAETVPIYLASSGEKSAAFAGAEADGLICLGPRTELLKVFQAGTPRRPALAQISVCWAESEEEGASVAHHYFPEVALPGNLFSGLETPREFSEAAKQVRLDDVRASIVCGPDPRRYVEAVQECFQAGFQGVALHQIGPDQVGFFRFWERELRPKLV
jgi:G6PDH family F420-dependent oxidoreductase